MCIYFCSYIIDLVVTMEDKQQPGLITEVEQEKAVFSFSDFQFDSTEINHLVCTPAGSGALPELPALGPGHVFRPHRGRHAPVTHSLLRPPLQSHLRRLQQALRLLPQVHDEGHVQPGGTGRVQIHPRRQTR